MTRFTLGRLSSLTVLVVALLTLGLMAACTGEQGPEGPAGSVGQAGSTGATGEAASTGLSDVPDLAAAWRATAATAKYLDEAAAIAAGYLPTEDCVASPDGVMGLHYVNPGLIQDPTLDPTAPEVLQYIPTDDGVRLIAVEYMFAIGPPGGEIPDPAPDAPSLFGQTFVGPMAGHGPDAPPHYDMHVWLWEDNPDGVFADFNPALTCPE